MIEVGTRLQNNETGTIVTVVETTNWGEPSWKLKIALGAAAKKWVFYNTPAKGNRSGTRRCRIAAARIFPLPADGRPRKKGYTVL